MVLKGSMHSLTNLNHVQKITNKHRSSYFLKQACLEREKCSKKHIIVTTKQIQLDSKKGLMHQKTEKVKLNNRNLFCMFTHDLLRLIKGHVTFLTPDLFLVQSACSVGECRVFLKNTESYFVRKALFQFPF